MTIDVPQPPQVERSRAETPAAANGRENDAPANGHREASAATSPPRPQVHTPVEEEPEADDPNRPRKKGWWQRKIFG